MKLLDLVNEFHSFLNYRALKRIEHLCEIIAGIDCLIRHIALQGLKLHFVLLNQLLVLLYQVVVVLVNKLIRRLVGFEAHRLAHR